MAENFDLQQTGEQVQRILNSAPEMEERTKDTTVININAMADSENTYTLETAIAALADYEEENNVTYRKSGLVLTYKTASDTWESKQFLGDDVEDFAEETLWDDFGSGGQPAGDYATRTELAEGLATKQNTINDLDAIRSGAEKGATSVQGVKMEGDDDPLTPDENGVVTVPQPEIPDSVTSVIANNELVFQTPDGQSVKGKVGVTTGADGLLHLTLTDEDGNAYSSPIAGLRVDGNALQYSNDGETWTTVQTFGKLAIKYVHASDPSSGDEGDLALVGTTNAYVLKVYVGGSWVSVGDIGTLDLTSDGITMVGENKTLTEKMAEFETVEELDLSEAAVGTYRMTSANKWTTRNTENHYWIPCQAGDAFKLTGRSSGLGCQYGFLTDHSPSSGGNANGSSMYSGTLPGLQPNEGVTIVAPNDAIGLAINKTVYYNNTLNDVSPSKVEKITSIRNEVDSLTADMSVLKGGVLSEVKVLIAGRQQAQSYNNFYIRYSDDKWLLYDDSVTKKLCIVPVNGGEKMEAKRVSASTGNTGKKVHLLKSIPDFSTLESNTLSDMSDERGYVEMGDTDGSLTQFVVPSDCRYVVFLESWGSTHNAELYLFETSFDAVKYDVEKALELSEENSESISNFKSRSVRRVKLIGGYLSSTTGASNAGSYPTGLSSYINYVHTPKFIRISGQVKIKADNIGGDIIWYTEEQVYLGATAFSAVNDDYLLEPLDNAALFRVCLESTNNVIVRDYINIECDNGGYEEQFQKRPVDSGYQALTFIVDIDTCKQPSSVNSEITQQYVKSTDSGMLHLPSNYNHKGKPTPLIIFLHGQNDRYLPSSTRFAGNAKYSPEWDAAGYAQLDVDMMPDYYNYEGTSNTAFASTDDDLACVEAAYEWCINHFNIARDGIYLIGRSRGGKAVMQILGRYNPSRLPILCAISNAGAQNLFNYELTNMVSATEWEMFCKSHGLPVPGSDGCPQYTGSGSALSKSAIVEYLRTNINVWWSKTAAALPMLKKYPDIVANSVESFDKQLFDLIVSSYTDSTNPQMTYCEWLNRCELESPVPLRFDWCFGDQTQKDWEAIPWSSKIGQTVAVGTFLSYNGKIWEVRSEHTVTENEEPSETSTKYRPYYWYAKSQVVAFLNNKRKCNVEYRIWPTAPVNAPSGSPTNPHYHELMNFLDGDYTLPNGVTITNPSMARLEWLLWCQKHDRRFNGSVQPAVVSQ